MGSRIGRERHLGNDNTSFLTPSPKGKRLKVSEVPCGPNTASEFDGAVVKRITRSSMSKQCSEMKGQGKKFQEESEIRSLPDRLKNKILDCVRDKDEKIKSKPDDASSKSIEQREKSSNITKVANGLMCASQGKKRGYDARDNEKSYLTRSKGKAENLEEKSMLIAPRTKKMKLDGASSNNIEPREKSSDITQVNEVVIVQDPVPTSTWRQVEGTAELSPSHVSSKVSKGKKQGYVAQYNQKRYLTRSKGNAENLLEKSMVTGEFSRRLALEDDEDRSEKRDFEFLQGPRQCAVSIPPYVLCSPVVMERDKNFEDESEIRSFSDRLKNPIMDFLKDKDEKVMSKSERALTKSFELQEKTNDITPVDKGVIVQGVMCASSSLWRQVETPAKLIPSHSSATVINGKKHDCDAQDNQKHYLTRSKGNVEKMTEKSILVAPCPKELEASKLSRSLAHRDDEDYPKDAERDFEFLPGPRLSDVSTRPFSTCSPEVTELEKKFEDKSENKNYSDWLKNLIASIVKHKDENIISKLDAASNNCIELQEKSGHITEVEKGVIEQGMSASSDPGRQMRTPTKLSPSRVSARVSNEKKHDYDAQASQKSYLTRSKSNAEKTARKSMFTTPSPKELETDKLSRSLARRDDEGYSAGEGRDFKSLLEPRHCDVSVPPLVACSSSGRGARTKVRATLRLFQALVRKILQGEETNLNELGTGKMAHVRAANVLKEKGKYINTEKVVGAVPGVEIGDIFSCRLELAIIGIHTPQQSDIDTVKKGNTYIATSVVASEGYDNGEDYSDVLIYTGQGENPMDVDTKAEDQKLERGNLALKNCIDERSPVRVIRGVKEAKPSDNGDVRAEMIAAYTYDGLYTVERYWYDLGPHGNGVYKFELIRISGQKQLAWKEVKHSNKCKIREGGCVDDISNGREKLPICAVNTIDDEKPPPFTYITGTMYPDWCRPLPLEGCNCKGRCSDSRRCACARKNGGGIPYNLSGAIVEAKTLVYECGPSCNCPPSCPNRVSQHGIKLPLEIFKTKSMGWGVRCRSPIPSGSFICEYIGELLDDKEAEQRIGSDEYLFDIGQNYNDNSVSDGLSDLMPPIPSTDSNAVEDVGFTIDAARYGNIGRFINHSCSPNLYAQNVLYDHEDNRIPHVMLFAAENIPPLQELTYDYNYKIDQVFDSKGNIKKKNCYCGSAECTGRLY